MGLRRCRPIVGRMTAFGRSPAALVRAGRTTKLDRLRRIATIRVSTARGPEVVIEVFILRTDDTVRRSSSRGERLMRRPRHSLLFVLASLAVCVVSTSAIAEPQETVVDLSKVGGPVSDEVRSYRGTGSCDQQGAEDCLFVSSDGVGYTVLEGTICNIDVDAAKVSKSIHLPYGLKFGDQKLKAVAKLPKVKGVDGRWFVSGAREGYDTGGGFYGASDSLEGLVLWFDTAGRLVQAEAHATCV